MCIRMYNPSFHSVKKKHSFIHYHFKTVYQLVEAYMAHTTVTENLKSSCKKRPVSFIQEHL